MNKKELTRGGMNNSEKRMVWRRNISYYSKRK